MLFKHFRVDLSWFFFTFKAGLKGFGVRDSMGIVTLFPNDEIRTKVKGKKKIYKNDKVLPKM